MTDTRNKSSMQEPTRVSPHNAPATTTMTTTTTSTTTTPTRNSYIGAFRSFALPASPIRNVVNNGSQDSSLSRSTGTAPRLQPSSSNVSQTSTATNLTSPASSWSRMEMLDREWNPVYGTKARAVASNTRPRTPDADMRETDVVRQDHTSTLASPMSLASPASATAANRAKRTANGTVKNYNPVAPEDNSPTRRSRAASMGSSGSRAGEAAEKLKTRLAYAMMKVQNGWENRSMAEVETLASQKAAASLNRRSWGPSRSYGSMLRPQSSGSTSYSPSSYGQTSPAFSVSSTQYRSTSPPPPKRHSSTYTTFFAAQHQEPPYNTGVVPSGLAPAADIRPSFPSTAHRRSISSRPPPLLSSLRADNHDPNSPRTPRNPPRPAMVRTITQTQQAEQDTIDALMLMGSPNNSGHFPHTPQNNGLSLPSTAQASPFRAEFAAPRRVAFESRPSSSESESRASDGATVHRVRDKRGVAEILQEREAGEDADDGSMS
ncbi:hypothetical protein LTR50_006233 [Elasticomyces elasticus]|nr:hypothetical protein LTR50_006233 [Elasticomyces elasticus]